MSGKLLDGRGPETGCLFGGSVDLMMVMVKMLHDDGNLAAPHLMNPVAARFGILGLGVAMIDPTETVPRCLTHPKHPSAPYLKTQ